MLLLLLWLENNFAIAHWAAIWVWDYRAGLQLVWTPSGRLAWAIQIIDKTLVKIFTSFTRAGWLRGSGRWLTITTSTEVQNKGGGVLRLRNCQAIIDLIKAKRHRWLPYSAAVLHKVGRVKVTQEVGGRRCLPGLPLAMHFGIGKDKHKHTHKQAFTHVRCEGERLQHQKGRRGTCCPSCASHSQTFAFFSLKICSSIRAT